jgi:hypothetical protein
MNLTVEQRQEKIRLLILDVLRHKDRATAREISFELQVYDIWKSPREITGLINGDPQLKDRIDIDFQNFGGWQRLTFHLRRDLNAR